MKTAMLIFRLICLLLPIVMALKEGWRTCGLMSDTEYRIMFEVVSDETYHNCVVTGGTHILKINNTNKLDLHEDLNPSSRRFPPSASIECGHDSRHIKAKQWDDNTCDLVVDEGENALGEKHSRFHAYFYSFYTYAASVYQAMGDNWSSRYVLPVLIPSYPAA
ncbi:hypothetical protein DPMN_034140, partial [Dreissena polymorpha]